MSRDPEFWRPANEKRVGRPPGTDFGAIKGGRPRLNVKRTLEEYPPPTPQRTNCRLWQGPIDQDGYGVRTTKHLRERKRIHRWIWEMANGPIPPGMVVRHKCDNRVCYRLSHLELGTVADNNRDAAERGHLGVRSLTPSQVVEIQRRNKAGESYAKIHRDFPNHSLGTIKNTRKYIDECLALVTDSQGESPPTTSTCGDATATAAPPPTEPGPADTTEPPTTPPTTTPG